METRSPISNLNDGGWKLKASMRNLRFGGIPFNRRPNYILATKVKALKAKLTWWSSSTYENLEKKKDLILSKIAKIDNIQQNRSLI